MASPQPDPIITPASAEIAIGGDNPTFNNDPHKRDMTVRQPDPTHESPALAFAVECGK